MSITVSQQFVKVFDSRENDPLLLFLGFCFCFLGFFLLYFFWGGFQQFCFVFVCLYCFVLFWFWGFFLFGFFVWTKPDCRLRRQLLISFRTEKYEHFHGTVTQHPHLCIFGGTWLKLCAAAFICFYCVFEQISSRVVSV